MSGFQLLEEGGKINESPDLVTALFFYFLHVSLLYTILLFIRIRVTERYLIDFLDF